MQGNSVIGWVGCRDGDDVQTVHVVNGRIVQRALGPRSACRYFFRWPCSPAPHFVNLGIHNSAVRGRMVRRHPVVVRCGAGDFVLASSFPSSFEGTPAWRRACCSPCLCVARRPVRSVTIRTGLQAITHHPRRGFLILGVYGFPISLCIVALGAVLCWRLWPILSVF